MSRALRIKADPARGGNAEQGCEWLQPGEVARFAGKSERHVRRVLQQVQGDGAAAAKRWQGLVTRAAPSGAEHAVEVLASSLPPHVQEARRRASAAVFPDLSKAVKTDLEWRRRRQLIADALAFPRGSKERAAALQAASQRRHTKEGAARPESYSLATLYAWAKKIEAGEALRVGAEVESRDARPSAKVLISRSWDKVCPLDAATKTNISRATAEYARSLWRQNFNGWNICSQFATTKLVELCKEAGWPGANFQSCKVPRRFVERPDIRIARELAILEKDADRQYSTRDPRIRRTREGLMPWEIVCLDVHPLDIIAKRADGSEVNPRLIAWYDIATGLTFSDLVICEKDTGIRQAHIMSSFARMVQKHGLPRVLQIDNGKENASAAFHEGFSMLRDIVQGFHDFCARLRAEKLNIEVEFEEGDHAPAQPDFMTARPYHPASKPIERWFAAIESWLRPVEGYIGGNRMAKLTSEKGRAPRAFGGTIEELQSTLANAVHAYSHSPARDDRKSPIARLEELQALALQSPELYRAPAVDLATLAYAMSKPKSLQIRPDGIRVGEARYHDDRMLKPYNQRAVPVRVPAFDAGMIFVQFPDSLDWVQVGQDRTFGYEDREGAREQQRRKGVQRAELAKVAAAAPKIDSRQELRRHAAALPAEPAPLKGPVITLVGQAIAPALAPPVGADAGVTPAHGDVLAKPSESRQPARPRVQLSPERIAELKARHRGQSPTEESSEL